MSPCLSKVAESRVPRTLYSTFTVTPEEVFPFRSLQMPPTNSPGFLGTAAVFIANPCFDATPSTEGIARTARAFVSWKNTTHLRPWRCHCAGRPALNNRLWTSPCPWGFVRIAHRSPGTVANLPLWSVRAATSSCMSTEICPSDSPKNPCSLNVATTCACVCREVITTTGKTRAGSCARRLANLWNSPMVVRNTSRNERPVAISAGSVTFTPLYPSLSPSPPATITKAQASSCSNPKFSKAQKASEPTNSLSPSGTSGTIPVKGFTPFLRSSRSPLAFLTYSERPPE
mmetsp:Transcript_37851/g.74437  ORF Transcript_37851/g.74437 Transcript_37851/m.74437 type:complete len:287 (-) Transcript_37851:700-1560(-)